MERCDFCGDTVKYGEIHACSFDAFDYTYSEPKQFSENTSNSPQLGTPCEPPRLDIFSDFREIEAGAEENALFTASSENVESWYRPENSFRELLNISPIFMESTGDEEEKQRESNNPDLTHATGREEGEMSRQENKWLSLHNDKMNFIDFLESVVRTDHSDNNNIFGLRDLLVNPEFIPGSNEPEDGKMPVSEHVIEGHTSLEMHSQFYCKKMSTTVQEHISSKAETDTVAGPSGVFDLKKKLPAIFSKNNTIHTHHQTHTDDKTFIGNTCKRQFSRKFHLDQHYRTHTGERPYECDKCGKLFSYKSKFIEHYRTHTGERPFVCNVCRKAFAYNRSLSRHVRTHKPYKCPVCGKDFMTSSYYSFHMTFHE